MTIYKNCVNKNFFLQIFTKKLKFPIIERFKEREKGYLIVIRHFLQKLIEIKKLSYQFQIKLKQFQTYSILFSSQGSK